LRENYRCQIVLAYTYITFFKNNAIQKSCLTKNIYLLKKSQTFKCNKNNSEMKLSENTY